MLKVANLPNILLGIVLVLLIAASVSTLCSITLTASSTFSMDFVKSVIKPGMKEKKSNYSHKSSLRCVYSLLICCRKYRYAHS